MLQNLIVQTVLIVTSQGHTVHDDTVTDGVSKVEITLHTAYYTIVVFGIGWCKAKSLRALFLSSDHNSC